MKKQLLIIATVLMLSIAFVIACKKQDAMIPASQEEIPNIDYSYNYETVPNNFNSTVQITNAGARLGRVLFYDKKLSQNNMLSCASCHKQEFAFSDNVALSTGFQGGKTSRNSMPIINAVNARGFFWDHRTQKLEDMVLQPIKHQVEMGMEKSDFLIKKLNATSYYPKLFNEAFGTNTITKEEIGSALAQFIFSMFNKNSKADQANVLNGGFGGGWNTTNPILTPDEQRGASLFQISGCEMCHAGDNLRGWNDDGFENIGLDAVYTDKGLGSLLNNSAYDGMFKIPSLRNVGLTAPYMHDGRFATLEQVVEHYNSGVVYSTNLSPMLKKYDPVTYAPLEEPRRLNLSTDDKKCLVAFLKTLTDHSLITDPKFSNPFK